MSGTLLVQNGNRWKQTLPAVLLSAVGAGALTWFAISRLPLEGLTLMASSALLAYVLFRVLYPAVGKALPGGDAAQSIPWAVDADMLTLDGAQILRKDIVQVHVWPNRDALGIRGGGWVVNIETTGKNRVFRSLSEGDQAEHSAESLEELVTALGCRRQWERAQEQ